MSVLTEVGESAVLKKFDRPGCDRCDGIALAVDFGVHGEEKTSGSVMLTTAFLLSLLLFPLILTSAATVDDTDPACSI